MRSTSVPSQRPVELPVFMHPRVRGPAVAQRNAVPGQVAGKFASNPLDREPMSLFKTHTHTHVCACVRCVGVHGAQACLTRNPDARLRVDDSGRNMRVIVSAARGPNNIPNRVGVVVIPGSMLSYAHAHGQHNLPHSMKTR